jgi:hypothetical protein
LAPVGTRPSPKPNRSHSCNKHRSGTTNELVRRTPRPAAKCSGTWTPSSVRRYHCERRNRADRCWRHPWADAEHASLRRLHPGVSDSLPLKISLRIRSGATPTVTEVAVPPLGIDRLLPVRADLVARDNPVAFHSDRIDRLGSQSMNSGDLSPTPKPIYAAHKTRVKTASQSLG